MILEKLSTGETVEQILEAHPRLTKDAIRASLAFAAQTLCADVVYPVAGVGFLNLLADEIMILKNK